MKEAIISAGMQQSPYVQRLYYLLCQGTLVEIIDTPIPTPKHGQVLIRVVASGSNPKDWTFAEFFPPSNTGDDLAGYVEAVGDGVVEFRKGDRVAAFHEMMAPHGSFAEYAIAWAHTTFHLPENVSFEDAATIPLTAMTAAIGLFSNLRLPYPWHSEEDRPETGPLVIYGAGAAVGSFAIQLARKSGIHPLICVAGQSKDHVESLIDRTKGDTIVDYRQGHDYVVEEIKKALGGKKLRYALDSVGDQGSDIALGQVIEPTDARLSIVRPFDRTKIPKTPGVVFPAGLALPTLHGVPDGVEVFWTAVGSVHGSEKHFGYVFFRYISLGLQEGWFKPHPKQIVPKGLHGLAEGLKNLRDGKAHSFKYVYRIADTN
ncbi:alcohol dehydrogenase [Colletotrichum truncatum]|uniref:Alcohol dehydrogenase n=1 Tax=Colletotrichum truncatum TaxID=5467 RepID=A0ACC3Z0A3_COLTU|nr:alcohol dehydrogenase [Colletotrichum truncatum]KAF6800705.1 alcohol dehydrogenase [Colletotrichum truncatum]